MAHRFGKLKIMLAFTGSGVSEPLPRERLQRIRPGDLEINHWNRIDFKWLKEKSQQNCIAVFLSICHSVPAYEGILSI